MKFLDLNTGYSFDAIWENDQTKGYIFWFPNEQSTNITYTMAICVLTETDTPLSLSIEDNEIFSFIMKKTTYDNEEKYVDGYMFELPVYSSSIYTSPEKVGNYYAHVFNLACKSKQEGEFICKIYIGDEGFIRVGADFYGECEQAYINLSNFGVEIPETVQKAIYDSNILINRKFKELLSNYWDIVANKGSYKSLINSLKWFEWNKELTIKEIWKRDEAGITYFDDRELISIFENKIEDSFENLSKTTYMSLYYSAYIETDEYDEEYNPVLAKTAMKWSKDDMRLKMSLLAQFFGSFFMPIHTSLLHATVEDKVFTNTIKAICGANSKRDDSFGDLNYVESNIKEGKTFKIGNVRAQVIEDTMFGVKHGQSNTVFGVDKFPTNRKIEDIKTFASNYYTGPGVIIPIELKIPNQQVGDFIKQTAIDFTAETGNETRLNFYDRIRCRDGNFYIKFNFLAKSAMDYNIRFMFITGSSKTITYSMNFTVEDTDNLVINMYKVQAKNDRKGLTYEDFLNVSDVKYFLKITPKDKSYYTQYLPYMHHTNPLYKDYKGIKLSRTVIFKMKDSKGKRYYDDYDMAILRGIMDEEFLQFEKYDEKNELSYLIYVSKYFNIDLPEEILKLGFKPLRNELGFYPQFHDFVLMNGTDQDNYTISQYDAVCCAAEINHGCKNEEFRYGHLIDKAEWTFFNPLSENYIDTSASIRKPFVADDTALIKPGYYDITFRYSLTNGITHECKRESAFRIKVI